MIDFDDNIESYENDSDYLDDLRKYSDSPRDYLYNYYERYHKKRADFINGNFKDLGKFTSEFVYWFKEFLRQRTMKLRRRMPASVRKAFLLLQREENVALTLL